MKVIAGGRGTGRTQALITLAAEAEARGEVGYIVVHSRQEATAVFHFAKQQGLTIGFPITYDEFLSSAYAGRNVKRFWIDNAEMLLQSMTPVLIAAITVETP